MMTEDILLRNNVTVRGSGERTLVFAHGMGCDQRIWSLVEPGFAADHRVVCFDYVGAGGSQRAAYDAERYADLGGYAQDVLEIARALDLREMVFVGHSISGMIGLLAAIQAPEHFGHLIMIGASARYINDPPDYIGGFDRAEIEGLLDLMERNYSDWASFLAPIVMRNADRPGLASDLRDFFMAADTTIMRQFAEVTFLSDNRASLPRLRVPALLLQTQDDVIVAPEAARYLNQHLPGSALRQLQASGHYPQLSAPGELAQVIRDYLAAAP